MKIKLLFLLLFTTLLSFAQNPADVDYNFGPEPGFGGPIQSIVIQPDEKIIIGGGFKTYHGAIENCLIRLNSDGTKDTSFDIGTGITGLSPAVTSIILQPDGKIIVGGAFNKYKESLQKNLIRLNSDGTKDNSFHIGTGFSSNINSMALQPDGKIIVGGDFWEYQEMKKAYLVRLNSDGSLDNSFNIGTGFDRPVKSIILQPDGKIIVGGSFQNFQNTPQKNLIRLNSDGSKDTSFDIGTGFSVNSEYDVSSVASSALQPDGKILMGGGFNTYQGTSQNGLIRLNSDGSKDNSFNNENGFDTRSYISEITIQSDGKILLGGSFKYQGSSKSGLIRFNSNGSKDTSFDTGTGFDTYYSVSVFSICQQPNGKILVGGQNKSYQEITQNGLIRLNSNGSKDMSFNKTEGFDFPIYSVTLQSDGKILAGGEFTTYNGASQNKLIRFNPDGSKDLSFNPEIIFKYYVNSITLQTDGKILIGSASSSLIRLKSDGSKDNSFKTGAIINHKDKIVLQSDGKILVCNRYPNQEFREGLIRLNPDGSNDNSFNVGNLFGSGDIFSLVLQSDGKILAGGYFTTSNGAVQNYLIRLNEDGSKDNSFNIGSGFNSGVLHLNLQNDQKIIVNGSFSNYQGTNTNGLIRLNSDGSIDTSFVVEEGNSGKIASIQNDGKIIITRNDLIRLNSDGSKDNTFDIKTGFNDLVYSTVLQADGQLLVFGEFTSYQDNQSAHLIRLKGTNIKTTMDAKTTQTRVTCNVGSNGSASVSVSGGKSPYSYLWSNGATTANITGLTTGNYSCTITDSELATITKNFTITSIIDIQKPTITAPADKTANISTSNCTATGITLGTPITTDNCSVASVTNDAPTSFPLGNTTVTWTVRDVSNNIATAIQIVTVKDITKPTITAPANKTVNISTSNCTATGVLLGTPVTADNCTVTSVTNNAPTTFPVGNTTVIWTVKDSSNNTATATQIVTVKDVTKPTITAPPTVIINTDSNGTATGIILGTPTTADNCSVAYVTNNAPTTFPVGNTTVTWTVKDASNNTATATQIVTVKDAALTTLIPDINFEKKLIALGIDSGVADGKVLTSSISSLTSLDVSFTSITNLTGIQDFVALQNLNCNYNKITSLDFSKNIALISLDCSDNYVLTSLDLSQNSALTSLKCNGNYSLTTLNTSKNLNLTALECYNVKLTTLDVSKNTSLSTLRCFNNQLTTLDVSKNTALKVLNCYSNQLSAINISNNIALDTLNCNSNKLMSLDISKNINLKRLQCSGNKLISLNLKNENNTKLHNSTFLFNPNLVCIQVDDKNYSDTNWSLIKDASASYSEDCDAPLILASNNFTIESKGETCLNQNNGEISISAKANYNYIATINGTKHPLINNSLKISNLAPAVYNVSITITGEIFEQNFTLTIPKGVTITAKSSVSSQLAAIEITEGTAPYKIFINGEEQFETASDTFSVEVNTGDFLEVKTAKACEGIYLKEINSDLFESVLAHPNPTNGKFDIEIPNSIKKVNIELYTMDSKIISKETYTPVDGRIPFNIENQASGVYIAKIYLDHPKYLKIIKK